MFTYKDLQSSIIDKLQGKWRNALDSYFGSCMDNGLTADEAFDDLKNMIENPIMEEE